MIVLRNKQNYSTYSPNQHFLKYLHVRKYSLPFLDSKRGMYIRNIGHDVWNQKERLSGEP